MKQAERNSCHEGLHDDAVEVMAGLGNEMNIETSLEPPSGELQSHHTQSFA